MLPNVIPILTSDTPSPGVYEVANEAYHAGPGVSSTTIKKILRSPAHAKIRGESTPAMALGTALHEAILEPEVFAEKYVRWSGGRRAGRAWDEFQGYALVLKQTILTEDEWGALQGMQASFAASAIWDKLRIGHREIAAYAIDAPTGLLVKAKADLLHEDIIVDIKTTDDATPEAFQRAIVNYGYHISARYYLDVFNAALKGDHYVTFVWAVVEKKPPHGLRYYYASQAMLDIGFKEYSKALELYGECEKTNNWPAYADTFEPIELPTYVTRKYE